jgi:predicted membrane-bound spermidine synthase
VSGAVSFLYEVLWTRLLSHVIGGSIYAFALMLAAFLSGIAIGGGLGGLAARRRQGAAIWLAASQVGIGVLAAAVYVWMQRLIPAERGLVEFGAYAVAVMFPAALLIGATLPLGVRVLAASASDAGESTARVYVWNTTGAIFGSILAGFVVIPQLGFEGAIRLGVTLNLGLALACVLLLFTPRWRLAAPATALLLAAFVWYRPQRPDVVIANSAIQEAPAVGATEVFYAVGVSATVFAIESDGEIAIRTNGLPEASVPVKGSPQVGQVQHWLTALPIAARPEAESLLLVGLGGGVALEGVPRSVTDIDVIELEPQVVAANRAIADQRTVDPLQDARIAVIVNDARNALRLTSKRYDIIVSQPSHPWTAGASHLYTREFVNLSKQHLRDEGVFLQWVGAGFIDEPLLQSMTANLVERFANVRLYQANGSILFLLASDGDLGIEARVASTGQPLLDNLLWYSYMGLNGVEDFAAALVMDESATRRFSEGAGALTDDRNRMATHSHYLADGFKATELVESLAQYDMLAVDSRAFLSAIPGGVDAVAVANRLLRDGFRTRVGRFAAGLEEGPERLFIGGLLDGVRGRLDEARTAFAAALEADPFADYARYALIEPALPAIASGRADAEAMGLVRGLRGSAAAVVRGWELAGKQDVASLAALDRALGAADPRDLWYPEAVQLRADWRTRANDNARAADDALRMIDRALLIRPKPELLLLRAAAADVLDDDAAFVESVRAYLNLLLARLNDQSMPMTSTEAMFTDRRLFALRAKLDVIGAKSRRAREVAESATHLLETLSRRR